MSYFLLIPLSCTVSELALQVGNTLTLCDILSEQSVTLISVQEGYILYVGIFDVNLIYHLLGYLMSISLIICWQLLDERQGLNVMRFLQAINERYDLTEGLENLQCRTLIFVGESSQFRDESVYMSTKMGKKTCALVEVEACGSLVTEEHPYAMIIPIEFFLMGFGYHRQPYFASSSCTGTNPTSPSSHCCIAPELLSPESLGIKLKPIKTRVDIDVKV
ncbi:hypothetical protein SADUNF_Sadunf13G0031000 [Salix dunnii]|uniref:Pollen-specific protein SF21 n=1 Tax=Salix dunnii TaxID=1413687 RepID=A0A835JI28_9ROSI|nr:hypothetical protein SADUNF_Sadunf13G0031000 [Salix dunnii]